LLLPVCFAEFVVDDGDHPGATSAAVRTVTMVGRRDCLNGLSRPLLARTVTCAG